MDIRVTVQIQDTAGSADILVQVGTRVIAASVVIPPTRATVDFQEAVTQAIRALAVLERRDTLDSRATPLSAGIRVTLERLDSADSPGSLD